MREKARDDADEANAAKSIFLANVSHELRTPLNAIIGYSEMLHDELGDKSELDRPQFQQDLDIIIKSGRQLLTLIDDILDLSKIETGKMSLHCEKFSPTEIIRQACEVLAPLMRNNNNELQLDELRELPPLYNDAAKFRQIFTNLLSNANKFTKGGYISVSARELPDNPGWAEFAIRDTGIGMTSEQLEACVRGLCASGFLDQRKLRGYRTGTDHLQGLLRPDGWHNQGRKPALAWDQPLRC